MITTTKAENTRPTRTRNVGRTFLLTMAADDFRCRYCGADLLHDVNAFYTATIDHYHPKSKGGENTRANTVACCFACNQIKGDYVADSMEEAIAYVAKRRAAFMAYLLRAAKEHGVEIPTERDGGRTFYAHVTESLGHFATQAKEALSFLRDFEQSAAAVLERCEQVAPDTTEATPAGIFREVTQ